jgi:hypothetical protein
MITYLQEVGDAESLDLLQEFQHYLQHSHLPKYERETETLKTLTSETIELIQQRLQEEINNSNDSPDISPSEIVHIFPTQPPPEFPESQYGTQGANQSLEFDEIQTQIHWRWAIPERSLSYCVWHIAVPVEDWRAYYSDIRMT